MDTIQQKREERHQWLENLEFFDAFCRLYKDSNCETQNPAFAPDTLITEMDRYGVSKAIVCHGNAAISGAAFSNENIKEATLKYADRLSGIWFFLPEQCPEIPNVDVLFDEMKKNNIVALSLNPTAHKWVASKITIGRIMAAATERKVPVYLSTNVGGWEWIYDFMEKFPNATTIVTDLGLWGCDRKLRPLLEAYPNLHAELASYWVPEGVADMVKLYGAERLLYASGMPCYNFGCTMLYLINQPISYKEISMITSENIKRLIAWE